MVFNHSGDRFISGSIDGTARIWRYYRREWKALIIDVNQRDGRPSLFPVTQHAAGGGGEVTSPGKAFNPFATEQKYKVNMAGWNADDTRVVLAVNDFTVRIYNSFNGMQLHSVKVSSNYPIFYALTIRF